MEVSVEEAALHFDRLLARVEQGDEITINRAGKPVARLIPCEKPKKKITLGRDEGEVIIHDNWDDPIPGEFSEAFGLDVSP